ncbi:MAG: acyl carrier protein [Candidatus Riflebacteria bacterium]|nr:acyl carrier protein [Candidatus Riflebacteria bacterium]
MLQNDIKKQLSDWFFERTGEEIPEDCEYLKSGSFDSLDAFKLVGFIEKTYNLQLDTRDFQSRDFQTISGLAILISRKTG